MSISRTWRIFSREVKMGPRTMMVIWLMVFPILITVLVRLVFGGLIDPSPRLGIVDFGNSEVTADIMEAGVIDLTLMDDIEQLKQNKTTPKHFIKF